MIDEELNLQTGNCFTGCLIPVGGLIRDDDERHDNIAATQGEPGSDGLACFKTSAF